jgi:hypothetical protein
MTLCNVVTASSVIDQNIDTLSAVTEYLELATARGEAHAKVGE